MKVILRRNVSSIATEEQIDAIFEKKTKSFPSRFKILISGKAGNVAFYLIEILDAIMYAWDLMKPKKNYVFDIVADIGNAARLYVAKIKAVDNIKTRQSILLGVG